MAGNDYSQSYLQQRISNFIASEKECRMVLTIAGGGGHVLSTLSSTEGASRILLEGTVTYDRESYNNYIDKVPEHLKFSYNSRQAAEWASTAALVRAVRYAAASRNPCTMTHAVGIACTSALKSTGTAQQQQAPPKSRAHICVTGHDGQTIMEGELQLPARTRWEEDLVVSHWIWTCLEHALGIPSTNEMSLSDDTIRITKPDPMDWDTRLRQAAQRILDGHDKVAAIIGHTVLSKVSLPRKSLIFPGSFNPPHIGHVLLAQAAVQAKQAPMVWFELTLTNADKPPLPVDEVVRRVSQFERLKNLPPHGILLTNASLFAQKAKLLADIQLGESAFVIGTDTLVRILDPKYYNHSREKMLQALQEMNTDFVVGGRLEQTSEPVFVSGHEYLAQLPLELQSKFTLLQDFRVDISSTELRAQQDNV